MRRLLCAAALAAVVACSGSSSPNIVLDPKGPGAVAPRGTVTFTVTGLTRPHWKLQVNGSGATITGAGAYTAGPAANTTDIVSVDDGKGHGAVATVHVGAGVSIGGPAFTTYPGGTLALTAAGGSGQGYAWSLA